MICGKKTIVEETLGKKYSQWLFANSIITLIAIGFILILWLGWTFYVTYNIERPRYKVLEKYDAVEIRLYEPYLSAYVDVRGDYKTAINAGFRILAGYIFGGNTRLERIDMTAAPVMERVSESIAMTAPVTEQQMGEFRRVSFMMPGKYTLDTLPKPDDERIRFKEILEKKYAVIRFTWYPTGPRVESKTAELAELVQSLGYIRKGDPIFAAYNDPYSFPLLKRNEILIEIE
jgi:hypothetical protein